jgi:hypothetical protein
MKFALYQFYTALGCSLLSLHFRIYGYGGSVELLSIAYLLGYSGLCTMSFNTPSWDGLAQIAGRCSNKDYKPMGLQKIRLNKRR